MRVPSPSETTINQLANIGAVEQHQSSTEGAAKIMKHVKKFLPKDEHGNVIPLLSHSAIRSMEKLRTPKHRPVIGQNTDNRLEGLGNISQKGLEEVPHEFCKEGSLLHMALDVFFKDESVTSKGTLYYSRVNYGYRTTESRLIEDYKHAWGMFEFTTVGYVLLLALKLTNMNSLTQVPKNLTKNVIDQTKWVEHLAQQIVQTCWNTGDSEQIRQAADAFYLVADENEEDVDNEIFPYCYCNTEKEDDTMVLCSNSLCVQQWFHTSCITGKKPEDDKDWYCSWACRSSKGYLYCFCQTKRRGVLMAQCSRQHLCKRREWYHLPCLGKTHPNELGLVQGKWYCCEECLVGSEEDDDSVLNHSKALLWEGLNLLVRRDAVREGDGPEIIRYWKHDLLRFWTTKNYEYFQKACHLLAGANGTLGERLKQDIIWNRVANLSGRTRQNMGLDLLNVYINKDFRDMMKNNNGCCTEKKIKRRMEMISNGSFGKNLEKIFTASKIEKLESGRFYSRPPRFGKDVKTLVEELKTEGLFDYCPVRHHTGFEDFKINTHIEAPRKMGAQIAKWAIGMDLQRENAGT